MEVTTDLSAFIYLIPIVLVGLVVTFIVYKIFKKIIGLIVGLLFMLCLVIVALGILLSNLPQ